jgi:APA family basic amino acid/polyamine antiporter
MDTFRNLAAEPAGLAQGISLVDATMIVIGSMVGTGIFVVSADIARQVGSPGLLLLAWLITGVLTVMGALCYGELAAVMPHAGGQYVFLREAFGPLPSFLYGWAMFIVIQTGSIAAVAVAAAKFLGVLFPSISESYVLLDLGVLPLTGRPLHLTTQNLVAVVSILAGTAINALGVRHGARVQTALTVLKTLTLLAIIVLGCALLRDPSVFAANFGPVWLGRPWSPVTVRLLGAAMVGSFFAADAWNNVTFVAAEVRNPRRNLPIALAAGTGSVMLLYLLANLAYLSVLPFDAIGHAPQDRVASSAFGAMLGRAGQYVAAGAIIVSALGCNNGLILSGARIYYAMACDGLFFRTAARVNAHTRTPNVALAVQAIWASVLALAGSYGQLLDYVMFTVLVFYVGTVAGVLVLRQTQPDWDRPYKIIGYPIIPLVYMASVTLIAAVIFLEKPAGQLGWRRLIDGDAGRGLVVVLLGIPVYWAWSRLGRRSAPELLADAADRNVRV